MGTGAHEVEVTHGDRVIFPDAAVTKDEVVAYYRRIADRMIPHLRNRPLVMRRFPDGLGTDAFFQKQTPQHFPDWVDTVTIPRRQGGTVEHVVCNDADTLIYVVNQGAFELHTLLVPADRPEHPDLLVLDLDPSTDEIAPVIDAASAVRAVLEDLGVTADPMATGSRGVHVRIPLDGSADVDEVHDVARALARRVVDRRPDRFTIAPSRAERGDRVFVDWLRNGYGQHAVAPYSIRARPGAPVALPTDWDEVTSSRFDPRAFTVGNVFRRLGQKDDPWVDDGSVAYDARALGGR
jgi:bifunctional non-homologous end joining protein LigD